MPTVSKRRGSPSPSTTIATDFHPLPAPRGVHRSDRRTRFTPMKTAEIAQRYLNYFEQNDHTIVPSASLVSDDPTVMFTIAGMVPFVPYLTGVVPAPFPRAADVQKCIRTNDIE